MVYYNSSLDVNIFFVLPQVFCAGFSHDLATLCMDNSVYYKQGS
jgi:hypothetical protein